jgi:hypothetical protein
MQLLMLASTIGTPAAREQAVVSEYLGEDPSSEGHLENLSRSENAKLTITMLRPEMEKTYPTKNIH